MGVARAGAVRKALGGVAAVCVGDACVRVCMCVSRGTCV